MKRSQPRRCRRWLSPTWFYVVVTRTSIGFGGISRSIRFSNSNPISILISKAAGPARVGCGTWLRGYTHHSGLFFLVDFLLPSLLLGVCMHFASADGSVADIGCWLLWSLWRWWGRLDDVWMVFLSLFFLFFLILRRRSSMHAVEAVEGAVERSSQCRSKIKASHTPHEASDESGEYE